LPCKISFGTHREADREGDHVTAGGGIWKHCTVKELHLDSDRTPGQGLGDWRSFVSGLCSKME